MEIVEKLRDDGQELEVGIGLNSGTVVAGNVGGGGRLEFSVMGDAVNVASRIEGATRETGDAILLSEDTAERLNGDSARGARRRRAEGQVEAGEAAGAEAVGRLTSSLTW